MKPLHEQVRRLIEDANAEDVPLPDAQARIWDALTTSLGAPMPPLAAAAERALGSSAPASTATGLWSGAIAKIVIAGALGGGAVGYGASRFAEHAPAPQEGRSETASSRALSRPEVPHREPEATPPRRVPLVQAPAVTPSARKNTSAASRLQAETRLIAEVQRALTAGAPARALQVIEQHRGEFPRGALVPEREASRVLALCALGRHVEANAARERFAREWPESLLLARVRAACGR